MRETHAECVRIGMSDINKGKCSTQQRAYEVKAKGIGLALLSTINYSIDMH